MRGNSSLSLHFRVSFLSSICFWLEVLNYPHLSEYEFLLFSLSLYIVDLLSPSVNCMHRGLFMLGVYLLFLFVSPFLPSAPCQCCSLEWVGWKSKIWQSTKIIMHHVQRGYYRITLCWDSWEIPFFWEWLKVLMGPLISGRWTLSVKI